MPLVTFCALIASCDSCSFSSALLRSLKLPLLSASFYFVDEGTLGTEQKKIYDELLPKLGEKKGRLQHTLVRAYAMHFQINTYKFQEAERYFSSSLFLSFFFYSCVFASFSGKLIHNT